MNDILETLTRIDKLDQGEQYYAYKLLALGIAAAVNRASLFCDDIIKGKEGKRGEEHQ